MNEDENEKTKRHVKIKIFLTTQAFYLIVFNYFVYQNQFIFNQTIIEINTHELIE